MDKYFPQTLSIAKRKPPTNNPKNHQSKMGNWISYWVYCFLLGLRIKPAQHLSLDPSDTSSVRNTTLGQQRPVTE